MCRRLREGISARTLVVTPVVTTRAVVQIIDAVGIVPVYDEHGLEVGSSLELLSHSLVIDCFLC